MGLFDGLIGGVVGAEMATVVNGLIEKHGGIVSEFQSKGLGETVKSWVAVGPNQPVSGEQISQVLGSDTVSQLAARFGFSQEDLANKISQVLPQVVDKLTPHGTLPSA